MKFHKADRAAMTMIGQALTTLRLEKGFPEQKAFAKKHKLPTIQYWRIEAGKANLTISSLMRILRIHRISLTDFMKRV